jgi:hypothetical protein
MQSVVIINTVVPIPLRLSVQHYVIRFASDLRQVGGENTEGAIKDGQSRENANIGHTKRRKTKQKHNTICVRYQYAKTT